jgi:hypothetical protein
MRVRIPDEVIELARSKDIDEMLKMLWAAVIYSIDKKVVVEELGELLDPNKRRSAKMQWKQNRLSHTINKSVPHLIIDCPTLKNKSVPHLKKECPTLKTTDTNWLNEVHEESWGFIYSNSILLNIITSYIDNNITYTSIKYQIDKQWKEKYIDTQIQEAEKVIKKIWFQNLKLILEYLPHDDFWSKQILSVAKLNKKNRDGVPYYAVIMDRIKQRTPKVISIPTI